MSLPSIEFLVRSLEDPHSLISLSDSQWDLLIRQARNSDMLAKLADAYQRAGLARRLPLRPRMHMESAAKLADRQHRELRWEVQQISQALEESGVSFVLLKGAAYVMTGLPASYGRLVSDIDILVPREFLEVAEKALMMRGWMSNATSKYDQHYYRTWMHELPPMRHFERGTVLDVHHAILPRTARYQPNTNRLIDASVPVEGMSNAKVLSPVDMVLHSAAHLFGEGDLERGFRGIVDIDRLLRGFGQTESFWRELGPRAVEMQLSRPLFYALRYTTLMLGTPVPESTLKQSEQSLGGRSSGPMRTMMDALFLRALRPAHATTSDSFTSVARWLLYLRGHWLRMPPSLLIVHLGKKYMMSFRQTSSQVAR